MNIFNKVKESHLRKFINHWDIDQSQWIGISVNNTQYRNGLSNIQMESVFHQDQNMLQWGNQSDKSHHITLIRNKKIIKDGKVNSKEHETFQKVMAGVLHLEMLRFRENIIAWSRSLQTIAGQQMISGEEKALEWIKVSLVVLKKALEESLEDNKSTIQMMIFSGQRPEVDKRFRFKLRIYNLDIEILEGEQGAVLTVLDKKNEDEFQTQHQVLKSPIRGLINPIIDEILQVLPLIEVKIKKSVIEN